MTSPSQEPVQPAPLPGLTNVVLLEKIRETPRTIWYRACQEKLGREVLLKARPIGGGPLISEGLSAPGAAGPAAPAGPGCEPAAGALARAREEMVLLSRLHSDAIVAAIDASASGAWLYQMVELPPGQPLTRIFQERGRQPWPPPEALAIAEGVAEALEHAHRAGVIFRRLHPEDLFLAADGRVKISSLEWAVGPGVSPGLPGELSWLAPEVAGGAAATPAADSHALGLLLAWLLTGRDPPASGLRRADEKAVEALRGRGVREDLLRLVARLLDPSPENRPAVGAEALEAIRALRGSLGRPRPVRRAVILAGAAVLLLLAAALPFTFFPGKIGRRSAAAPVASTETPPEPPAPEPKEKGATSPRPDGDPPSGSDPDDSGAALASTGPDSAESATSSLSGSTPEETPADPSSSGSGGTPSRSGDLLKKERAERLEKGRAALAEFRSRDLPRSIEKAEFARAAKALEALAARFPDEAAAIADLRRELEGKEKKAVEILGAEIDRLLAAGDLEKARRTVAIGVGAEGAGRLTPPREAQARSDLRGRIAREERARAEAAARLKNLLARAREAFEAERFDEAASMLSPPAPPEGAASMLSPPAPPEGAVRGAAAAGEIAAPVQALSREIAIARAAWEAIFRGLDRAIAARTPIRSRVYRADGTSSAALELVLDERRGSILTAHRKGTTARMSLSAYDLESAALEALAGPSGGGDPVSDSQLKEGLLALLLSQGRPEAAAPLLAGEGLEAPVRATYAERQQAVRARRLEELSREAARRLGEISSRKSPAAAWSELKTWVAGIISRNASEPSFAERGGELERVFLASAREALRAQAPDRLFRGRVLKERQNGQVQVIYDFEDAGQAADWIPALKTTRLIPAAKAIRFAGALRFLKGDPFGGSMGVSVKVPAKGTSNPPHLGLILGSPAVLSPPVPPEGAAPEGKKAGAPPPGDPAAPSRPPEGGDPAPETKPPLPGEKQPADPSGSGSAVDAARSGAPLAFILGFVTPTGEGLVVPHDKGPLEVPTPASGIFAGAGLPPDPNQVILAAPTARHPGPLFVRAEIAPGHLTWNLNGKPVLQSLGEGALKALARLAPGDSKRLPGSIVIYSENEPVTIDTIEVYGTLDERWIEQRLEQLAREELEGLRRK